MSQMVCLLFFFIFVARSASSNLPIVINTWPFITANAKAWSVINSKGTSALDAIEHGCSMCDLHRQCGSSVGYGGSPDENGETTLDAMIMEGITHSVGAVADLRRVKSAISVARAVMKYTDHTLLVGDAATKFALQMGFKESDLHTNESIAVWKKWRSGKCQPNYWKDVEPDPRKHCGPYKPANRDNPLYKFHDPQNSPDISETNHDTIGMLVVDAKGNIAGGTTTNGMTHKIPGRVGDSPIVGAGAYVDNAVGGAVATGDGDVMMRFLPSFHTVLLMQEGLSPREATRKALIPIIKKYPNFAGALVATTITGEYGAACHNFGGSVQYTVTNPSLKNSTVFKIKCSKHFKF
ncbi:N(4)-(Beta-N-acetylglucosaminyl)-L-asparaginase [Octopus bimaculoides]|uniref:N(4)-(beta-N-acetylglucosaminyl)-L-asparaginase n=1 Tax=Octopus bimaculoides TaxID=37653 RepID=A0A0L8HMU8_OCTBM|nr:N(4)-(Beta-N-acetylglucosaminyl)-L-asparaginase [Octopus bimaculoides]|eukprot:XP_014770986.1 PREDICTED: N(4)-(Beta-N-acetylglucosaminyl)-L-asparaginase-like isoform X1 [Octopus bimaculoides]